MKTPHPRIRSPYNPQLLAEWLFDNGCGYINEPHFMLFGTMFYASDFSPQKRPILKRKTQEAQFFYGDALQKHDYSAQLDLPSIDAENTGFDATKIHNHLLHCSQLAQHEVSNNKAAFMAAHALLESIGEGKNVLLTDDAIQNTAKNRMHQRRTFIRAMKSLPDDLLEYAARKELPFYLETGYTHRLCESDSRTRGTNTALTHIKDTDGRPLLFHRQIYASGLTDQSPEEWKHIISHEIAHCIAFAPLKQRLNRAQRVLLGSKIKVAEAAFAALPEEWQTADDLHLRLFNNGFSQPAALLNLLDLFDVPSDVYPTEDARKAEMICDMIAMAYGELAGAAGAEKLRKHYHEHPEFAEAIISLRDASQQVFKQFLSNLRETNPLPTSAAFRG